MVQRKFLLQVTLLLSVFHAVCPNGDVLSDSRVIGEPSIRCSPEWLIVSFLTSYPLQGRLYVDGRAFDNRCSVQFTQNESNSTSFQVPLTICTNIKRASLTSGRDKGQTLGKAVRIWADIHVDFHPMFVTKTSQLFRVECPNPASLLPEYEGGNTWNSTQAKPLCEHEIHGPAISGLNSGLALQVGQLIHHKWRCSEVFAPPDYVMMLRNCDVISKTQQSAQVVDQLGCSVDELLITNPANSAEERNLVTTASSYAFKFLDNTWIRFRCQVVLISRHAQAVAIELPRCSVTKDELRERRLKRIWKTDNLFEFINPNRKYTNVTETVTQTDWIYVQDHLSASPGHFPTPTTSLTRQSAADNEKDDGSTPRQPWVIGAPVSPISFMPHKKAEKIDELNEVNRDNTDNGFEAASNQLDFQQQDEDGIDREGEEKVIRSCDNDQHESRFGEGGLCTWMLLNTFLLIWSAGSTIIWLLWLTHRLYLILHRGMVGKEGHDGRRRIDKGSIHVIRLQTGPKLTTTPSGERYTLNNTSRGSSEAERSGVEQPEKSLLPANLSSRYPHLMAPLVANGRKYYGQLVNLGGLRRSLYSPWKQNSIGCGGSKDSEEGDALKTTYGKFDKFSAF